MTIQTFTLTHCNIPPKQKQENNKKQQNTPPPHKKQQQQKNSMYIPKNHWNVNQDGFNK